jgi:WD40 repeat protein
MTARAHAAAIAPGGQTIAVATPSALTLFDGQARPLNRYPVDSIRAVAVGSGRVAYVVGRRVVVRRVAGGHIDASFRVPGAPEALAFSPNGGALAVGTAPGAVSIRRLDTGKTTRLSSSTGAVTSLAFSTAGALLAAGDAGGYVTIWRASGGVPLRKWLAHRRGTRILGVVFNRSNRLLATTGRDAEVRVWRVGDGRPVADLSGHFSTVNGVEFSPDGRWIVSAGPGKAGLWDLAGQRKLLFLEGHQGKLLAAAFDESGRRIETVGVDGTIRAYACGVCGRVPELLRLADARLAATGTRLTNHEAKALGIG